jgi:transposase
MKFRNVDRSQLMLMPPSVQDWLPGNHLARFICKAVSKLSLESLVGRYGEVRDGGAPAYDPGMMVSLLIYSYCKGCFSSRQIEMKTHEDVAYRFICGNDHPDHDTICHFRTYHEQAFIKMFLDVVLICQDAGLLNMGHVAIDGTKILANASGSKTMSYQGLTRAERRLLKKIADLVKKAKTVDAKEDAAFGKGNRGDDVPKELATAQSQLAAIERAKARLEERAKAETERLHAEQTAKQAKRREREAQTGKKLGGRKPVVKDKEQIYKDCLSELQENVVDPDSGLMKDGATKAIVQAYNAQIAVDGQHQIIVAAEITREANDKRQLVPMASVVETNMGEFPKIISADSGYFSAEAIMDEKLKGVDLYVPAYRVDKKDEEYEDRSELDLPQPSNSEHSGVGGKLGGMVWHVDPPKELTLSGQLAETIRAKLSTDEGKNVYRARGAIVESTFGQIKESRGFRRFSMRGKGKADLEWKLVCMCHNILKLWRSGYDPDKIAMNPA